MLKVEGRSFTKEWVYCAECKQTHVWLVATPIPNKPGYYVALCAKCRLKLKAIGGKI